MTLKLAEFAAFTDDDLIVWIVEKFADKDIASVEAFSVQYTVLIARRDAIDYGDTCWFLLRSKITNRLMEVEAQCDSCESFRGQWAPENTLYTYLRSGHCPHTRTDNRCHNVVSESDRIAARDEIERIAAEEERIFAIATA